VADFEPLGSLSSRVPGLRDVSAAKGLNPGADEEK
jgi:hypothetical protein